MFLQTGACIIRESGVFMYISRLKSFFFPCGETDRKVISVFFLCLIVKFLWFDLLWCALSSFTPFSKIDTYWDTILVALILLLPLICFRAIKTMMLVLVLIDLLLIANLMYFRTYFTAIPLNSYLLIGNLQDFTSSVWDSFSFSDLIFPISTLLAGIASWKTLHRRVEKQPQAVSQTKVIIRYVLLILIISLFPTVWIWSQGGFKVTNERLKDAYLHTCNVPMYTLFGSLYYDYSCEQEVYTDGIREQIEHWLAEKKDYQSALPEVRVYDNCIIILAESFESWVLERTIEGQEITPNLNALIKEATTIYAPNVLTQVKGGRSIDAQLMINSGLLPINSGAYSIKYPDSYYPSLPKAFKQFHSGARAYSLTVDKPMVWNQCVINPAMGYDSIISKKCFIQEEPVGSRKQVGDRAFLRQCADKILHGEVWSDAGHTLLQCVTYSGHNPFILPEKLKEVSFSREVPERINDYATMANYTDRAVGAFISYLRSNKNFDNTLIIFTGDHEGLAAERSSICNTDLGRKIVSDKCFTPLIILNAPAGMRYNKVMGQIDIYPTILDLLGLHEYEWKGLGSSILDPSKKGFAVDPGMNVVGDTAGVTAEEIQQAKDAWKISDMIIRYNYLGRTSGEK